MTPNLAWRVSSPIRNCTESPIEIAHISFLTWGCRSADQRSRILSGLRLRLVELPVYGRERLVLLRLLLEQGGPRTAAQLGVSRRVIFHWLRTGQIDRGLDGPVPPRIRQAGPMKLALFQAIFATRLETYPELSAVRLFDENFGGVARELLFDQMKAVIVDDERPNDGKFSRIPSSSAVRPTGPGCESPTEPGGRAT